MQNWRHAGRFNTDMIPLNTDGTTNTTGTLKLGTAGAPWSDLNLATGASIYIGGTQFQGGGGGAAIEVFEQKSHIEKIGYDYPLSNAQSQNESFIDSSAMILTLGKTHDKTELPIYLDRDAATLSMLNTTTGWTALTGTVAADATAGHSVNGTAVRLSVTGTNTSYFIKSSLTSFSLTDKNLKVWLYPDTLANITHALIRLESNTTTAYAEWQIPVAALTALTLNSLYLNIDSPDTTTSGYNRSAINQVYLGHKGTATPQAILWSWNYLRFVDNRNLKVPVQLVCDNGTNQEFINISTATVAGDLFTLAASTTNIHTISSTNIGLKHLTVSNGQGVIKSTNTGEAALTGWDIQRTYMNTSTTGDLIITSRWYDENYPVATITNASTTVLSITTSTVAAGYKTGDVVRLYKWEYIDQNYQSPKNDVIGNNFLDLTLTADGTATSSLLTLVHGNTSNQNLGGDTVDKWRGVRVSADDYYRVEAATSSQALIKAAPTIWIPKDEGIAYPIYVHSHWPLNEISGNAKNKKQASGIYDLTQNGTVNYSVGKLGLARGPFSASNYLFWNSGGSSSTIYDAENFIVDGWFKVSTTGTIQTIINKQAAAETTGWAVYVTNVNKIAFVLGNGSINTYTSTLSTYADGNWHYFCFGKLATSGATNIRGYLDGAIDNNMSGTGISFTPATTNLGIGIRTADTGLSFNGLIDSLTYWPIVPATWDEIERIIAKRWNNGFGREYGYSPGYIQKSIIPTVSGNKLITATRLTRQDATNQNPIIYQRNAVII